jgi:hypothetical protein
VETRILASDPCAVESIASSDSKRATADQVRRIDERRRACDGARAIARYEASCEALASHLAAGQLTAEDEPLVQASLPLMNRIVKSALLPEDLLIAAPSMPCQDSKSAERFWATYAKAAGRSPAAWADTEKVSDRLRALLIVPGVGLSEESARMLSDRAEAAAGKAIFDGRPESIARATALCDFHVSVGVDRGPKCKGLIVVAERLQK